MTISSENIDALLQLVCTAATAGGEQLLARYGRMDAATISRKKHADYATEADLAAENAIADILRKSGPEYGFLGEETGQRQGTSALHWVVDPLDGTSNFIWGIPYFSVSIALCDAEGEILGVVLDPLRQEMFTACKGKGAYLNGRKLPTLDDKPACEAMISISMPIPGQLKVIPEQAFLTGVQNLLETAAGVRRLGSAALDLAYIAAGRLDGYFEDGLSYYDIAAGKLIAMESGAMVTDAFGSQPFEGSVIAGKPTVQHWLRDMFGSPNPDRKEVE